MLVEKVTCNQSLSLTWFKQRAGRITASNFKSVCRTPIEKPLSVIKGVCYPQKMCFTLKHTKYGAKHEKDALSAYLENEREKHIGFTVKTTGFFISKIRPEYGASPDAMVECNCCGKGSVEIKYPYLLRNMDLEQYVRKKDSCLIKSGSDFLVDRGHSYFYQIQLQMFVTETTYCDFIIWSHESLFIKRIFFDGEFVKTNLERASKFFNLIVNPELLGRYFTEKGGLAKVRLWCICKDVDDGRPMIKCYNDECTTAWYHFSCIGLEYAPDVLWFCPNCVDDNS